MTNGEQITAISGSWRLGTAFGIGIYLHWTFFLLPLLMMFLTWQEGADMVLLMQALVPAIFGCVVLHELGHALMARRFGIPTVDITLFPIGGVARLSSAPGGRAPMDRPWEEVWIALAGPAVNVVIATILFGVIVLTDTPFVIEGLPFTQQLLIWLMMSNVGLVLFNLMPAFPMDGGRVLRAMLAMDMDQLRATRIAANVGMGLATLMFLVGLVSMVVVGNPMFAVVSMFVLIAGRQELAAVRHRAALQDALRNAPGLTLPNDLLPPPPEPNFSGFTWDKGTGAWIEWRNGQPVHVCWTE